VGNPHFFYGHQVRAIPEYFRRVAMASLPTIKEIVGLFKDAGVQWMDDKCPRLGAALAYYTAFSLAPLLVIVIALVGFLFGREAAMGEIATQLQNLLGAEGARAIEAMIASANQPATGTIATVVGITMLLVGALGLFSELQDALNTVWKVKPKEGRGVLGFLRDRLLSFTMVLGSAFLLLVSLVVSAALSALGSLLGEHQNTFIGQGINVVVSFCIIMLLFAMIYRLLPDVKIAWRDVWLGAAFTTLLFTIGKILIGMYLGRAGVASAYGAAGSLAALLVWLYYSAQIFLFGAELTRAFADRWGSRLVPKENAVLVSDAAHAAAEAGRTSNG
jgi:membrane protein